MSGTMKRIMGLFIVIALLTPISAFADGENFGGFSESGFIPGGTPDQCYGFFCYICIYTYSARLGSLPPTCGNIDIAAYCGCNIYMGATAADTQCEAWGTCYYHP